jgi:predicted metalloprotease with PDZ domain
MRIRNKTLSVLLGIFALIASCEEEGVKIPEPPEEIDLTNSFYYEVNLKDRSDDTFKVRMFVDNLTSDNAVFQFPATTPGTYDIHDIGRFVTTFKAFDEQHNEIAVTHPSTNQWVLSDPENTRVLEFKVKETFDTPVTENAIYRMAGTSMENDHTLFNAFDVLGFPTGLKERDFYLNIVYPSSWNVGTSLLKDNNGFYYATDFDKLVDSPLLFGYISSASTTVVGSDINVFAFSKNNLIQSQDILSEMQSVLDDANAFLNGLPAPRYSFIYLFDEFNAGALEHSYSSVYVLQEQYYSTNISGLRDIAAHEFFHVVTPLNIHSEIIEDFNFAEPTASEHLWLYEGVTEWASEIMQYRNQSMPLESLLSKLAIKKTNADHFAGLSSSMSLSQMSLTSYEEGGAQFGNVYNRGALVAALLDIRLLELSGGTKGLREVILALIETYGPENAFSEENFFNDLATLTGYPTEITDFINRYIKGTEEMPLETYFDKIGIIFTPNTFTDDPSKTSEQQALFDAWSVNM